ncbi:alpha/beta-hydrolase [Melanomma pulvis-pyrius CBS 109.77]|uniref:Carboxylic ester hydrolase n=1 Tax=Melanomma pulvis-pyrius CBS 109.77 TaxID=1314802 RepID=A0A6A6XB98_9PLEO|nr:alpha/beta-hydrolase [Melanomma pulvis-pyrius CBS 109.77]
MFPRLLSDRRIVVATIAVFASLLLSFAFFYSSSAQQSYEWLPRPYTSHTKPGSTGFTPPPKNAEDPDVVELDYLSVRSQNTEAIRSYWNIPYAASAGALNRFRGPQPPPLYKKTLEWSGQLGMCPRIQKIDATLRNHDIAGDDVPGLEADSSEDCLSLNVFVPIDAEAGDELPVCFVIPGGGFHLPGRSNGAAMVEKSRVVKDGKVVDKGIIVVTLYYRNGIYGFLSGDEIQKDGDFNGGLRDQRTALEWVQKYIRYFGGNADHVVIMGTSAGGASAMLQLTGNGGDNTFAVPGMGRKQLFHGVLASSPASPTFYTPEQANHFWEKVALGVNCTDLSVACVRNASVDALYWQNYPMSFPGRNTPPRWMWAPTPEPEGGIWTEPSPAAIFAGRYAKVPTLMGFTSNEGTDQVKKETDTVGDMKSYLKDHYPLLTDDDLGLLARNYPNDRHWPDSGRYWDAVAKAQGDIRYICPTYLSSNAIAANNPPSVKAWQYQWDVVWGPDFTNGYGTKHAVTVGHIMSPPRDEISDYMMSFVKHLDPNVERAKGSPKWDPLDMKKPRRMFFTNSPENIETQASMEDQDMKRDARCEDVRRLMPRLQMV